MRRKALGRDPLLSIRMAIALAIVVLVYVAACVVAVALAVAAIRASDGRALLSILFFTGCFAVLAWGHLHKVEQLTLHAARARILFEDEEPGLHTLASRLAAAADVPRPRLALIHSWAPNAFGVGLSPARAVIAVTTELLRRLDEGELEAVLAHELAHVANRDGMVMTFVGGPAMAGSALWHAHDWRGKLFFPLYLPLYVLGLLLMWTMSRYREYAADRGACLLTGAPEELESALVKVAGTLPRGDLRGGPAISALCIVSTKPTRRFELFMDHPPLEKRLARLAAIAQEMGRPVE